MTEPELPPLDDDLTSLLASGRPGEDMPEELQSQILASVLTAGSTAATGDGAASTCTGAAVGKGGGALGGILASKAVIGVGGILIGTVMGAAGHALVTAPQSASSATVPVAVVSVVPAKSATEEPEEQLTPVADSSAAPQISSVPVVPPKPATSPDSAHASGRSSLRAERAILDVARMAVARGDGQAALTALQRHKNRFPEGQLREEREALWNRALRLAGRNEEAEEHVDKFREAFPDSMLQPASSSSGAK